MYKVSSLPSRASSMLSVTGREGESMNEESKIILAADSSIFIDSVVAISDAVGKYYGAEGLILTKSDVLPEFFNLRSGLAGEMFQKFTNYRVRLAIVLQDSAIYGERVGELIYEHKKHSVIRFFDSVDEARVWLSA
jgi:hypothetical protein